MQAEELRKEYSHGKGANNNYIFWGSFVASFCFGYSMRKKVVYARFSN